MSNIFLVVVFLASLLYITMKYKPDMKNGSTGKLIGAFLLSIALITGALFLIYFGNNWISGLFENFYSIVFTQFVFVLIILSVCTFVINLMFKKASGYSDEKTA